MKKNLILFGAVVFLAVSGCAKKKMAKADKMDEKPVQETAEAEDVEASIRGKDFSSVPQLGTVYFDLDSSLLREDMLEVLAQNAEFLKKNSVLEIRVDGHCDERGTTEYNMALGQRRASAIRAYYKSLGIAGSRVGTLSWGEEKSVCRESTDSCWNKNRRAETMVRSQQDKNAGDVKKNKNGSLE